MGCAARPAPHERQRRLIIGCSAYRLADFGASGQRFELSQVAQWPLDSTGTCESGVVRPGHVVDQTVGSCMYALFLSFAEAEAECGCSSWILAWQLHLVLKYTARQLQQLPCKKTTTPTNLLGDVTSCVIIRVFYGPLLTQDTIY